MLTWTLIAFLLLVVVVWNNFRVQKARRQRGQRNFRTSLREKQEVKGRTKK
jgi:hypothetical protein